MPPVDGIFVHAQMDYSIQTEVPPKLKKIPGRGERKAEETDFDPYASC